MLNSKPYYHGTVRKLIVLFGKLFSDIKIERKGKTKTQTIHVPIEFAPKEKWIQRLENDPNLNKQVQSKLPRMAFTIGSYQYDSMAKTNKMSKITCYDGNGMKSVFSPVPYTIPFELNIVTKGLEDGAAIVEQIIPWFTPDYTVTINAIPEMNIKQDVPIILNGVDLEDNFDGDYQQSRFVIHTLSFTVKTKFYGAISEGGLIENVYVNISEDEETDFLAELGITTNQEGEITETWDEQ